MEQMFVTHWGIVLVVLYYIITAAISAMPENKADFNWYDWFYHWTHQMLNQLKLKVEKKLPENKSVESQNKPN